MPAGKKALSNFYTSQNPNNSGNHGVDPKKTKNRTIRALHTKLSKYKPARPARSISTLVLIHANP